MTRVSRVTAVLAATLLAGAITASTAGPASSATPSRAAATPPPVSFKIASFNVLGASHTPPGGRRASGATRIVWANQLLDRHQVDVAGFQEMQASQLTKFLSLTNGAWAVYPGFRMKAIDTENSIGWRTDKFELVQGTTVRIPYFDGTPRDMPLVLLREKATGMLAYVTNYHNPADTGAHRNQARWRSEATRIEIALQNQLYSRGIPRFLLGDMNERAPYFCRVASHSPVQAARPTSYIRDGVCHADRPRAVDWILGARKVAFSDYDEDRTHLVDITTDHPVISATATVDPARMPRAWGAVPPPVVPQVTR